MNRIFSIYWSAIRLLFYKWRAWVVVFVANILFAISIALPFDSVLKEIAAHSDAPLKGLGQFDVDFWVDVVNNYGSELQIVWGQVILFVFLYLLLNIFFSGGLIEGYIHLFKRFSLSDFFANCTKHFWRLFRLALYFVGTQIFVVAILAYIYSKLGMSPFELESEGVLIRRTRIMFAILVVLFAWIDVVHEYAKVKIVAQGKSRFVLPSIVNLKFFVLKNLFSILGLYLLCALTYFLLTGISYLCSDLFGMGSTGGIIAALLMGQLYLFFRVGTRLLFTTAATDYMREKSWGDES